ncbi:MAG: efflux RND transporter periplasmic adaptor subunit [Alsobacter sp.]
MPLSPLLSLPRRRTRPRSPSPASARGWRGAFPLLLLPALGAALAGCNEQSHAQATRPPTAVLATDVRYEPVTPDRSLTAVIRPRVEADLGFRVPGKVARRLVDVGQAVKAGDALADLDDTDLRLQREQAEADARALSTVVAQAVAEEQRALNLRRQGWTADATVDKARATADDARARKERADRALALAENALAYAVLRADADGVVSATLVDKGQVVQAGQAAIRVARLDEKEAAVAVPEALVNRIGRAQATLSLWASPGQSFKATLRELSPVSDAATRTYAARFALPGAGEDVRLGMTATLTLSDAAQDRAARLPLSALFNQGAGPSVWIVDEATGALALRPVEVAGYGAREVLVRSGVSEGEKVVSLGVQKLDPGAKVRVVQALGL